MQETTFFKQRRLLSSHSFKDYVFFNKLALQFMLQSYGTYEAAHSWPKFSSYNPCKHKKPKRLLVFSGGIKWKHWPEMG